MTANTFMSLIRRTSPFGIPTIQTALMTRRLKAADLRKKKKVGKNAERKKMEKKSEKNKISVCDDQQCFSSSIFITINALDSFSPCLVAAITFLLATVPTLQEQTNKQKKKRNNLPNNRGGSQITSEKFS